MVGLWCWYSRRFWIPACAGMTTTSERRKNIQVQPDKTFVLRKYSPLEGESARQGRSPQPSRWGDKQQACLDIMDNFIDDAIGLYQTMSGKTWD